MMLRLTGDFTRGRERVPFCAGLECSEGKVTRAAPILKRYLGWRAKRVVMLAKARGWEVDELSDPDGFPGP